MSLSVAARDLVRRNLSPPSRLAGRLGVQSLLYALGEGTFMTGSAVFFTQIVGLQAKQIGLGLTIAGVAAFAAAWPSGRLVDRFGPKRLWALSAVVQAALFATWPFIHSFPGYIAMAVAMEVVGGVGGAAYGAYSLDVLPPNDRVKGRAFSYSALNLGFTLGAVLGGIALAFHNLDVLRAVPLVTAGLFLVNAAAILRLPRAPHDLASPDERRVPVPGPGPLRNPGWLAATFFIGVLWTNQVLLNVVIPLWLVERTDAPRWLLAFLFGTNTVMCIVLPMAASRGVRDVGTALRAIRRSSVFFVGSCLITLITHDTIGWVTIALVWLGHVTVTGAELFLSAASWTFEAELMDPRQRGAYQGASELSGTLGRVWAPAVYTFLAMEWGQVGWLIIAAIGLGAAAALHPSAKLARRFVEGHVPAEALAAAAAHAPTEEELAQLGPLEAVETTEPLRP
ncbi:MAG: MFS transporter [Dermatophilaceae bacterium]